MTLPGVSSAEQVIPSSCSNSTNPLARQSLVSFRMITFAMVVAAGQVILGSHLAGINDRRAKKEISLGLTFIKGIVFVANGIIFFTNPTFQSF